MPITSIKIEVHGDLNQRNATWIEFFFLFDYSNRVLAVETKQFELQVGWPNRIKSSRTEHCETGFDGETLFLSLISLKF